MVLAAGPHSPLSGVVIRLGGFHLLLSFMGSIGAIMAGSGLEEMWETVYAKNSVVHMMNGRAYARGIRAHFISQSALATLLLESAAVDESLKEDVETRFVSLLDNTATLEDLEHSHALHDIDNLLSTRLTEVCSSGRTEKLWVQYFKLVAIIRLFIRAERCGDWQLHLYSVWLVIPYLHAAGHLHYARSAQVYLQEMLNLANSMAPGEYDRFTSRGFFTVRRSDKYWCGIWTGMRSLKTSGGLTRGRGISPSTIAKWVHSMPAATRVIDAMETFSGVACVTSEQHVDLRESNQRRDHADTATFLTWLNLHHPFQRASPLLASLASGVVASAAVNCDDALSVGEASMKAMEGKVFSEIHLQRKNNVRSLASVTKAVKVRGEDVFINPNQLFHRIVCIVRSEEELAGYLTYELAACPPALFDDCSLRKGNKSSIVTVLDDLAPSDSQPPYAAVYTIDGGHLLHRVVWQHPATYGQICEQYKQYTTKRYGCARVVFDGYDGPSTKDAEHSRRVTSPREVLIEDHIQVSMSQQEFLGNTANKVRFIALLTSHLEAAGCEVHHASADADRLIVLTALDVADTCAASALVGEDTDLLILLTVLSDTERDITMLMPGHKGHPDKVYSGAALRSALGGMVDSMLFLHAATGCDTTSAVYRKGKRVPFRKLQAQPALCTAVQVFNDPQASKNAVAAAGEAFLCVVYGGKIDDNLDVKRHQLYLRTIAKQKVCAKFDLATLPPTSAAARQHSFRVYHQVQQWRGVALNPTDWGWRLKDGRLTSLPTLREPAPETLLHLITCNCRSGCERNCECRRSGLPCTSMCGFCAGHGCSNHDTSGDTSDGEDYTSGSDEDELDAAPVLKRRRP